MASGKEKDIYHMPTNEFDQVYGAAEPLPESSGDIPSTIDHSQRIILSCEADFDDREVSVSEDLNFASLIKILDEILSVSAYQDDVVTERTVSIIKSKIKILSNENCDIEILCRQIIIQIKSLIVTFRADYQEEEKDRKFAFKLRKAIEPLKKLIRFDERVLF